MLRVINFVLGIVMPVSFLLVADPRWLTCMRRSSRRKFCSSPCTRTLPSCPLRTDHPLSNAWALINVTLTRLVLRVEELKRPSIKSVRVWNLQSDMFELHRYPSAPKDSA